MGKDKGDKEMRIQHTVENGKEVDYMPLGNYVVNYESSGQDIYYVQDSRVLEYAIERAIEEFKREIPEMAKRLLRQGALIGPKGYRLEFNMGAFKRIVI